MKIYKTELFGSEDGLSINRISAYDLDDEGFVTQNSYEKDQYQGSFTVQSPMGSANIPFEFPEDFTMKDCFDRYEEIAKIKAEELQQEMQKNAAAKKIITPSEAAGSGLIMP